MKAITKLVLIALLIAVNVLLVAQVKVVETDVKQFFPELSVDDNTSLMSANKRYLFVSTEDPDPLYTLEEEKLVDGVLNLPGKENVYLIFFDEVGHKALLNTLSEGQYMGTSIVGTLMSDEFIVDLNTFLMVFIPLIIPVLAFVTSVKFALNTLGEVLFFSVFMLGAVILFEIELNAAYLLALLFSYIYVFTLINQIYFNQVGTKSLGISLAASLVTTWLSGALLSFSGFGVIADFGKALMIWIVVLALYLGLRLMIRNRTPHQLQWFKLQAPVVHTSYLLSFISLFVLALLAATQLKPVQVNLNPLGMSSHKSAIEAFENSSTLSQPIWISIAPTSDKCTLRDLECNQKISDIISVIESEMPVQFSPVLDLNSLYTQFTEESFTDVNAAKFAQFKLGLDMLSVDQYLYGRNFNSINYIASISLLEPVDQLIELKQRIETLNAQQNQFELRVEGHLAQIAIYQSVFLEEMFLSVLSIFILLGILFVLFYKRVQVLISLLPAAMAIAALFIFHSVVQSSLSIMTLIAIILFIGLIADNIIHILMTYRMQNVDCFKTVFKPIILSNLVLILSLLLMAVVNDGFLQTFGTELAILLISHLLFLVYILPSLFQRLIPRSSLK